MEEEEGRYITLKRFDNKLGEVLFYKVDLKEKCSTLQNAPVPEKLFLHKPVKTITLIRRSS